MSAVAGSPAHLTELSGRVRAQSMAHGDLRNALRRTLSDLALTPATALLASETAGAIEDLGGLARSFEDLASFVFGVAEALDAADVTLLGIENGWIANGAAPTRRYLPGSGAGNRWQGQAARRSYHQTGASPLGVLVHDRVTTGRGSVRDSWVTKQTVVADFAHTTQLAGGGATARLGGPNAHLDGAAHAGVRLQTRGGVTLREGKASASIGGRVEVGVSAAAAVAVGSQVLGAGGATRVFAGAMAEGDVSLSASFSEVEVEMGGRALVGAEFEVEGEVTLLGASMRPHAGVIVGAGAEVDIRGSLGFEKVGFRFDVGVALGLGVSTGVDLSFNPKAVVGGAVAGAEAAGKAAKNFGRAVGGLF